MNFRDNEKQRYQAIKPRLFSAAACNPGPYHNILRDFCLAEGCSLENLFSEFRGEAIQYFRQRGISWHDGLPDEFGNKKGLPSNHLCCSQSACVNALWPMTAEPALLTAVFQPFLPEIADALPFDADQPLPNGAQPTLAFEWIGAPQTNYLGEIGHRQRGANATSADFAFRFLRKDGRIQLILGEWKYTENYPVKAPEPNATRRRIYKEAFKRWQEGQPLLPNYEYFFVEPFYQLMRLTLLAQAMERARLTGEGELGAEIVSVMVIAPAANRAYRERFTSPVFAQFGANISDAWRELAPPQRFASIATEELLASIEQNAPPNLLGWRDWLMLRYRSLEH